MSAPNNTPPPAQPQTPRRRPEITIRHSNLSRWLLGLQVSISIILMVLLAVIVAYLVKIHTLLAHGSVTVYIDGGNVDYVGNIESMGSVNTVHQVDSLYRIMENVDIGRVYQAVQVYSSGY